MNEQEIEQWLKSANLKQLSAEANERIRSAILATDETPSHTWWRRRIPMWQAAAACVAISVLTLIVAGMINRTPTRELKPASPSPIALSRNEVLDQPPYLTDASKWRILYVSPERNQ